MWERAHQIRRRKPKKHWVQASPSVGTSLNFDSEAVVSFNHIVKPLNASFSIKGKNWNKYNLPDTICSITIGITIWETHAIVSYRGVPWRRYELGCIYRQKGVQN